MMRKTSLLFLALLSFLAALDSAASQDTFKAWKKKYNKTYTAKTEAQAQKAFEENAAKVAAHNSNPSASYKLGLNANSDIIQDDASVKGIIVKNETTNKVILKKSLNASPITTLYQAASQASNPMDIDLKKSWPTSIDYSPGFPPIKDKGSCLSGSMAISVVDVINYWSKKNGSSKIYSEQNMIDCVTENFGCNGGGMYANFKYAITNGLAESSNYKYVGKNQTCQVKKYPPVYFLQNACLFHPGGNETMMERLLVRYGPLATFINTGITTFSLYKSGIFYDALCDNSTTLTSRSEAVVVVGFKNDPVGGDYWIVRPAFGSSFGMNGYARIAKNKNNQCGIANLVEVACVY